MVTQEQIDALNEQIASGTRQVVIGDQSITSNTTASLIQARNDLMAQKARETAKAAGKVRPRQVLLQYGGRGYD